MSSHQETVEVAEEAPQPEEETLEQRFERVSNRAMEIETAHKEVCQKRRECDALVREIKEKLEKLRKKAADYTDSASDRMNEVNGYIAQMNELSAQRAELQPELDYLREAIAEKNKVTFMVTSDGLIEAERDNTGLEINLEGWEDERNAIFGDTTEKYDSLSKFQIGILAKLLVAKKPFRGSRIEFILDESISVLNDFLNDQEQDQNQDQSQN